MGTVALTARNCHRELVVNREISKQIDSDARLEDQLKKILIMGVSGYGKSYVSDRLQDTTEAVLTDNKKQIATNGIQNYIISKIKESIQSIDSNNNELSDNYDIIQIKSLLCQTDPSNNNSLKLMNNDEILLFIQLFVSNNMRSLFGNEYDFTTELDDSVINNHKKLSFAEMIDDDDASDVESRQHYIITHRIPHSVTKIIAKYYDNPNLNEIGTIIDRLWLNTDIFSNLNHLNDIIYFLNKAKKGF